MRENCDDDGFFNQLELARHFAEWQKRKDQETIELAEDHAMLAGMEKMREEMMKMAEDTAGLSLSWGEDSKTKIIIIEEEQQ
jgi:hypothetical protein